MVENDKYALMVVRRQFYWENPVRVDVFDYLTKLFFCQILAVWLVKIVAYTTERNCW